MYQGDRDAAVKKERNTQPEGRSGSGTMKHNGPAVKGSPLAGNPTMSGGINRPTRGKK